MTSRIGDAGVESPTGILAMFAGQGSQRPGMAAHLLADHPSAQRLFARSDEITGLPLSEICVSASAADLSRTVITQPAIVTTSLAIWELLRSRAFRPTVVAGHSLGEFSALVAAETLSLESALALVTLRGRLMDDIARVVPGAMTAVMGLPADRVTALCRAADSAGVVEVANYNEPLQTVVSGDADSVAEVGRAARAAGADRVAPLDVGAPFHCSLMKAMEEEFTEALRTQPFADPVLPVLSSVTGDYVRTGEQARDLLRRQLTGPVRWVEVLGSGARHPVSAYTEIGPGRVLSGLARRTHGDDVQIRSTGDARRLAAVLEAMVPDADPSAELHHDLYPVSATIQ